MGYDASRINDDKILVEIPPWRYDILHEIDLVEDVSVGYGYDNFKIDHPKYLTYGKLLKHFHLFNSLRGIMIGLGYNEVTTFTISNEKTEFELLNMESHERVEIQNPISEDYTCLRLSLIPSLLNILKENRHHSLPQNIFELGIIVDEANINKYNLAAVKMDAKTNFSDCKSTVDAILRDIGKKYDIKEKIHPAFIKGRVASILYNKEEIGYFGEFHPKTITNFELEHPIIGFEIKLSNFIKDI
jgi:phenylalanyl-tRNA synthetase beta chain